MFRSFLISAVVLFIITNKCTAQETEKIIQLKKQLTQSQSDTALISKLCLLCYTYSTANIDSAVFYGEKALQLSRKINYKEGIANAYTEFGWAVYHNADYETAKEYFNNAIELYASLKDSSLALIPLNHLAYVYMDEGNNTASLNYFIKGLKIAQSNNKKNEEAFCLYGIGVLYNKQNNYEKAREYFLAARPLFVTANNEASTGDCIMAIANTYNRGHKYDSAIYYYNQAETVFKKLNDIYRLGRVNENIGIAFSSQNDFAKALTYYLQADTYYKKLNSRSDIAYVASDIGESYAGSNNYKKAIQIFTKGLQMAKELNDADLQQSFYQDLASSYKKLNDYKNAFDNLSEYGVLKDSLSNQSKTNELLKLQTQFETEKKDKENQLLKAHNDVVTSELYKKEAWLVASLCILSLIVILLIVVYKNRQQKIKTITILHKQRAEILRMNNILEVRALRAQMDPHFIFNCMASLQALIWENKNNEADSYLSKFSRLLRMVLENSEHNTVSLDKELDMLKRYLELESIRLKEKFNYTIKVDDDVFAEAIEVPTLIIQPFAENALWHGLLNKENDRSLKIEVRTENEMLICIVEDNGIGRERSKEKNKLKQHNSKAIKIIEERLHIIREQTKIKDTGIEVTDLYTEKNEPCGTKVLIRIPIKQST